MSDMFTGPGPSDDAARSSASLPAFLEDAPGSFKPLDKCSRSEIEARILSVTMQADALIAEAKALDNYLDTNR
ncbi:hypothetical protein [Mycolicibacter sinensis]|uniref:hypothetical protein n=1 Tax=Mycolicibacter sinensis (strain JDM601) TaxID=875328 RepID=UPI000AEDB6E6|nr:hypothetical protein [Mycolicibacter sinensis]